MNPDLFEIERAIRQLTTAELTELGQIVRERLAELTPTCCPRCGAPVPLPSIEGASRHVHACGGAA